VPAGKRETVLAALDEEGVDYVVTDETSGREYNAVVSVPLPTGAVEPVLEAMREAFEVEDSAFDADVTRELYHTDVDGTCEHIWALPEDCAEIMLVGHNPVWSDAVSWLTGVRTNMPKGAAAVLTCRGEAWSGAVQRDGCGLLAFVRPAELR